MGPRVQHLREQRLARWMTLSSLRHRSRHLLQQQVERLTRKPVLCPKSMSMSVLDPTPALKLKLTVVLPRLPLVRQLPTHPCVLLLRRRSLRMMTLAERP